MAELVKVAEVGDLDSGEAMVVEVKGEPVALFNVDDKYYAIHDTCPHAGGPLSEGDISDTVVTCPWHASDFDLTTGEVLSPPADVGVACFTVVVEGDDILIEAD